jgi:hypothetical protein
MASTTAVEALHDLIAETTAKAESATEYLGSEAHRLDLRAYAQTREPGIDLQWAADSYWEPGRVYLRKLAGVNGEAQNLAEEAALVTLHETLHERWSRPEGRQLVYQRLKKFQDSHAAQDYGFLFNTFNFIEDERISRVEASVEPQLGAALARFGILVIQQWEETYAVSHGGSSPWSATPPSKTEQFVYALTEVIFGRGKRSALDPTVDELITACAESIGKAITSSSSFFDSADAAFSVYDLYDAYAAKLAEISGGKP